MSDTPAATPPPSQPGNGTPAVSQDTPSDSVSPIQNQKSKIKNLKRRRRRSKVAGLPKAIRDQVNQMLDDGFSCPAVRKQLAGNGIALSDHCIARWYQGGYQDHRRLPSAGAILI